MEAQLRTELRRLRGRRGLVASSVGNCPAIKKVLGEDNDRTAVERLKEFLQELGISRDAEALRWAYGIGASSDTTVDGRRSAFISTLPQPVTPKSVETWENHAIEALISLLVKPPGVVVIGVLVVNGHLNMVMRMLAPSVDHLDELRSELMITRDLATPPVDRPFIVYPWLANERANRLFFFFQMLGEPRVKRVWCEAYFDPLQVTVRPGPRQKEREPVDSGLAEISIDDPETGIYVLAWEFGDEPEEQRAGIAVTGFHAGIAFTE